MKYIKSGKRLGVNSLAWYYLHQNDLNENEKVIFDMMRKNMPENDIEEAKELSKESDPLELEIDDKKAYEYIILHENPNLIHILLEIRNEVKRLRKENKDKDLLIKDFRARLGLDEHDKDDNSEDAIVERVYKHLNEKTHRKRGFNPHTGSSNLLRARIREGHYTEEDFIKIIDIKYDQWWHQPKMRGYLNPSTLFRIGHIDDYLAEANLQVSNHTYKKKLDKSQKDAMAERQKLLEQAKKINSNKMKQQTFKRG